MCWKRNDLWENGIFGGPLNTMRISFLFIMFLEVIFEIHNISFSFEYSMSEVSLICRRINSI